MARLPRTLPDDRPVALLIRHAERPPIPKGTMGLEIELTPGGLTAAKEHGARLGARIVRAHTSAVRRCVQTAHALLEGAQVALAPVPDPALGLPSTFVIEGPDAERTIRSLGFEKFMLHLLIGDEELPGLPHPAEGARRLRDHALSLLTEAPGLHLLVTHDAMIGALVARCWKDPLDATWWPEYLEAAALWRDGERILLSYRDRCHAI